MLGMSSDELRSVLSELIRVGKVTSTDDEKVTARVQFEDRDDVVSYDLPVIVKNTLQNKDYWMPDVNEPVLCFFLPVGIEQGFIIGSFYTNIAPANQKTKDVREVKFKDGTSVNYNRSTHTVTVDVPPEGGSVVINAHTKVTVNSPSIDLGESASLEPSVLGDKLATWITSELKPWLDSHNHGGATPTVPFLPGTGGAGGAVYSTKNKNQ